MNLCLGGLTPSMTGCDLSSWDSPFPRLADFQVGDNDAASNRGHSLNLCPASRNTEHDWLLFIFMVFTFPSVWWVFRQVIMILSQLERTQPYHLSRRLVHRVANPNTGLSDWAARQDTRHDPPMAPAVASLHAPRPL